MLACEGGSDAAVLHGLGYEVIGRPNDRAGGPYLREWLKGHTYTELVIVYDNDPVDPKTGRRAGLAGAQAVAKQLDGLLPIRLAAPPGGAKDVRAGTRDKTLWEQALCGTK